MAGDTLLAVLLLLIDLLLFVGGTVGAEGSHPPPWFVSVPLDVAMVAPLVIRRKKPLVAAYLVLLIAIPHAALSLGFSSVAALAMSLYSVLVYSGRKQGLVYVGALAVITAVQVLTDHSTPWLGNIIFSAFGIALCWTLGEFVGARRAYQLEVEARLHLLETERDQATRIAVAEERGRIARELHDVVAHSVSVMVVQADGAALALPTNPELAGRALQTISETGRGALGELRRLLEVLRGDHDSTEPRVPQPDANALAELAERMRGAGVPVELEVDDSLTDLPAGVSLGIYRIVQESLTNTLKHAGTGARAEVRVHRTGDSKKGDAVEVLVRDDGAGRARQLEQVTVGAGGPPKRVPRLQVAGGNGLIGMRERANVYGGTLEVGPAPAGGWQVRAVLPVRLAP
ncbi:sensor histidine kinase [Amycolatopsis sp. FDAARGOS 1241]|uniref:sensor histidine kinase n=1 Tax=Amycolatopsis sp. FDAARGOS 1241 TaxID=2778070 RepID=UPI00194E1E2B|nr:histidine kinase [Amycolatopsis sp. FDAARGOS 1241]QRP51316.1 sensor histidine kinase [Amycolatopsis sp. FDAARGOS 1241]